MNLMQAKPTASAGPGRGKQDHECPICQGRDLTLQFSGITDRLGIVKDLFDFYRCLDCQSVSVQPLPKKHEIPSFYPEAYSVEGPQGGKTISDWIRLLEWKMLNCRIYRAGAASVVHMTGLRSGNILEIGCSSGYQLVEFKKHGAFDLRGVDIDHAAIEHARTKLHLNVLDRSVLEANLPASSFDLVLMFNVLEHLVNPVEVLAEVHRLLRPGGYLAIKTPMIDSLQARLFRRRWVCLLEVPRHVVLPSMKGIERLVESTGFKLTGRTSGPAVENSISVALSILPRATSTLTLRRNNVIARHLMRFSGVGLSLLAVLFVSFERLMGPAGGMIHVMQKEPARGTS